MEKLTHFYGDTLEIWEENKNEWSEIEYISGELIVYGGVIFEAPNLTDVGSITICKDSKLIAPKLNNVEYIFIQDKAKLEIPQLGDLNYRSLYGYDDLFVIESSKDYGTYFHEDGYTVNSIVDGILQTSKLNIDQEYPLTI